MNYTITVSETGDYILIVVKGNIDGKVAMQYTIDSHKLGNELGIMKFLLDVREAKNVQMMGDNYNFAAKEIPTSSKVDRRAKVACIVSPDDHSHDFIETVLQNNGVNLTLFRDIDQAIAHLQD